MATKKYVITGVGGFVGRALALALKEEGHEVVGLARANYPELEAAGITLVQADITKDVFKLQKACDGADALFHVAAKVDMWGKYDDFYKTNVVGTLNVIEACRATSVSKLIYTSSPSVVADGNDLKGIDESYPYPTQFHAFYPETKAKAEREVLAADNIAGLKTISLRPHLIFGPGDRNFVPTILSRARAGRLVQVGDGKNMVDVTFIDDCIEAHLCALRALDSNPSARGKAYFISQGEPVNMWSWINEVLELNGQPKLTRHVPKELALALATVFEFFATISPWEFQPMFTRFLVNEMTTSHYFNIAQAQTELAFKPKYSVHDALKKTFYVG